VIAYFTTETECESDMDWNEVVAIITIIVVLTVALGGVWVIF
jgi:heme/copper-type cytochrome/quinol oxidase subunit 4